VVAEGPLQHQVHGVQVDRVGQPVGASAYEPDRDLRRRAHESLYKVLGGQGQLLTFLYDTLIQDHQTMDRLRVRMSSPKAISKTGQRRRMKGQASNPRYPR